MIGGALVGAGGAVTATAHQLFGSTLAAVAWVGVGASMALVSLVWRLRHEEALLRLTGARRPTIGELRRLATAAQTTGAPISGSDTSRVLLADSTAPVVKVGARHVVVTTALFDRADSRELAALVCHARHHVESGAGLRRALLASCAWPILLLDAAGARLGGGDGPGSRLVRRAAGFVLWPVKLLVFVVALSREHMTGLEETGADEHTRRAGLGAELGAALRAFPSAETSGGAFDRIWTRSRPPMAARLERLEPARPLDGFFGDGASASARTTGRGRWVASASGVVVLLVAFATVTARGDIGAGPGAAVTASSFAATYLDDAFQPARVQQLVRRSVPPSRVQAALARAGTSPLATMAELANGLPTTSRATNLGCRLLPQRGAAGSASVLTALRWDYAVGGSGHSMTTVATVTLGLLGGRWRPTDVPTFRLFSAGSEPVGGAGSCSS